MNLEAPIERIRKEIHNRAILLICDNPRRVGDLHFIETAMLIGASVVMEQPLDPEDTSPPPLSEDIVSQLFEGIPQEAR